jgi:hypothetical protein
MDFIKKRFYLQLENNAASVFHNTFFVSTGGAYYYSRGRPMFESKCGSSISIAFAARLLVSLLSSSFCFDGTIRDQKILLLPVVVANRAKKSFESEI